MCLPHIRIFEFQKQIPPPYRLGFLGEVTSFALMFAFPNLKKTMYPLALMVALLILIKKHVTPYPSYSHFQFQKKNSEKTLCWAIFR